MNSRSSASTPPVSANTVCTRQPRSCSQGTQKLVSRPPEKARTMSLESETLIVWFLGGGPSPAFGSRGGCGGRVRRRQAAVPVPASPAGGEGGAWLLARERGHHRLLHVQAVLGFLDGDAVGRVHHRVGRLDVAAQRQAVAEHAVVGQRHLPLVDDEVPVLVADRLL